ncbi:hypothetical protein OSC52_18660 [Clostridium pasteurianum]|uniref:hypothetical protein n=1 Tax=Clostridium pasteurianum TaxID=1501 RepID=UPI002260A015|nr:hypothetical protein [Clostridium pasteurianum]UZW13828.1 hypothetical protein OSC52_18660 [Clostridium pasteurianum]
MLQVIQREFEKLTDLIEYINDVSIRYGYLKDYEIIKENDKYNLLLKFDVPEGWQVLELAKLKNESSRDTYVYKTTYSIDLEDEDRSSWSHIFLCNLAKGFKVQGSFGIKSIYSLIKINYDRSTDHFTIELENFDFEPSMIGWHTDLESILLVKNVDHKVIFNHLLKVIFNRGYLIDKISLKELEENLEYVAKWLNEKDFKESVK